MSSAEPRGDAEHEDVFAVVMAGGSGTRFWPSSRRKLPKQFLPLGRDASEPLLAATVRRVAPLAPTARTLVVTAAALASQTLAAVPTLAAGNVLLEPVARNTAPCVAWATAHVAATNPRGVLVVLPADAYIADDEAFVRALRVAVRAARDGAIVTLGIEPTRPETGYGYLHKGLAAPTPGVFDVRAFVEKPDAQRARAYLEGGEHLWNAGIFVFRADVMTRAFEQHQQAIAQATARYREALAAGRREAAREQLEQGFASLPSVSIDTGVMEKVGGVQVVPVACGWSDVGSWQAAWELGNHDAQANELRCDVERTVLLDAEGNLVLAPAGKVVALVGVRDLVVVDTPDALLVLPRERSQDVKRVVDELAARKLDGAL